MTTRSHRPPQPLPAARRPGRRRARQLARAAARRPHDHFELGAEETSIAQRHRTVSEMWYVLTGLSRIWRQYGADEPSGISGVSGDRCAPARVIGGSRPRRPRPRHRNEGRTETGRVAR